MLCTVVKECLHEAMKCKTLWHLYDSRLMGTNHMHMLRHTQCMPPAVGLDPESQNAKNILVGFCIGPEGVHACKQFQRSCNSTYATADVK